MASFSIMENFTVKKDDVLLKKACELRPRLYEKTILPVFQSGKEELGRGDSVRFDFGSHYVGYLTLTIGIKGSHADAPACLRIRFAERQEELQECGAHYQGWLGKGWIQEELVHVDVLPGTVELPRRYAMRYIQIDVIDTSPKYRVVFGKVEFRAVTSVDAAKLRPVVFREERFRKIDEIGSRTLMNCMQDVFEDGPKRDRRMWLGDLRIQALADYETFRNYDLVKRSLYFFAGLRFNENQISSCIFTEPEPEPDDTYLLDYAFLYMTILREYYEETGDIETLRTLYPWAKAQFDHAEKRTDGRGLLPDQGESFWCFLDWGEALNKEAGANAVLSYCLKDAIAAAEALGYGKDAEKYGKWRIRLTEAMRRYLYDEKKGLFFSGEDRQYSIHTQVWMLLADAAPDSQQLTDNMLHMESQIAMTTPYMYYYYVIALLKYGRTEEAKKVILSYWGGMADEGADTFFEVYCPGSPEMSPYGSTLLNSYCHAWSCGVVYVLRKYYKEEE